MVEVSERVISAEAMRAAIRAKLHTGASREAVCWLICTYAPVGASNRRTEGGVPRLPVEVIRPEKRAAFLDALSRLSDAPIERRGSPRQRVLVAAQIIFLSGYSSMSCRILDVSKTGALVQPADLVLCPNKFLLKPSSGASRYCEVMWRKGDRVGVRYIDDRTAKRHLVEAPRRA